VGSVTEIACHLVENVSFEKVDFRAPCDFDILLLNLICPLLYGHLCIICELNNEPIRGCKKTQTWYHSMPRRSEEKINGSDYSGLTLLKFRQK